MRHLSQIIFFKNICAMVLYFYELEGVLQQENKNMKALELQQLVSYVCATR